MPRKKTIVLVLLILYIFVSTSSASLAQPGISISDEGISITASDDPQEVSTSIKLLLILTILTLLPSILIMMTSFIRIIIVLSFLRN
ncbi:MAG: flagellar biosynthetic protein FliP, partial [Clostridiaceae bacterium]|nr:flagellar biosynthetic protein FliP [Clostridiaceae bacterium]